jgi:hypothetical protein
MDFLMPARPIKLLPDHMLQDYRATVAARREPWRSIDHSVIGHLFG